MQQTGTLYETVQSLPTPPYPSYYAEATDQPGTLLWASQLPLLDAAYEQHAAKLNELGFEVEQKPFTEILVRTGEMRFIHIVRPATPESEVKP